MGGSCGPHVRDAFQHLAQRGPAPPPADPEWARCTFGPQHATYLHLAHQAHSRHPHGASAILYADQ
eukprot:9344421-Prorocentrum_lima.AAC.1